MFLKGIQEKEIGKSRKTIPKVNTTCKENGMEKSIQYQGQGVAKRNELKVVSIYCNVEMKRLKNEWRRN